MLGVRSTARSADRGRVSGEREQASRSRGHDSRHMRMRSVTTSGRRWRTSTRATGCCEANCS
eukprot:4163-Prymnesium_polylepis.1